METLQTLEKTSLVALEAIRDCNKKISAARNAVAKARAALEASDYKRHKNAEYAAVGLELPYSWEEIHAESQVHRDTINEFEPKIKPLEENREILKEEYRVARAAYVERLKELNLPPYEKKAEEGNDKKDDGKGETWVFEQGGAT